jgi:hypothetical protein
MLSVVRLALFINGITLNELVEIDGVPVKLGSFDAGKTHFAVNGDAAAAAHARAVDHDGVRLTVQGTPKGRAVSTISFIMIIGPMAMTRS